jgi:hypothetical protein
VDTVEGSRPSGRRGARQGLRPGDRLPDFGPQGELTPATIAAADLTPEEQRRAREVMAVQAAYLDLLEALDYVVGPDGAFHSLLAIPSTKLAIAFHLAKVGFRRTGTRYVSRAAQAPPPAAFGGTPQPGEGWHTPPTVTTEHVPRDNP